MRGNFPVVLDACVLATYRVCDLYLRLAEKPHLYSPVWSQRILDETERAMRGFKKKPWPADKTQYWRSEVEGAFPESSFQPAVGLENVLTNDPKDRHVLAAAIASGSSTIVTFNLKDFPASALEPWGVHAVHPGAYLVTLYTIDSGVVVSKLTAIAERMRVSPQQLLKLYQKFVPLFAQHVAEALNWEIPEGE